MFFDRFLKIKFHKYQKSIQQNAFLNDITRLFSRNPCHFLKKNDFYTKTPL